jgi:hypothetical protein
MHHHSLQKNKIIHQPISMRKEAVQNVPNEKTAVIEMQQQKIQQDVTRSDPTQPDPKQCSQQNTPEYNTNWARL